MDPNSVSKARSRLNTAKTTVNQLQVCNQYEQFSQLWYVFLFSCNGVYTVLEQGAKISPQSRQWFGSKKNERRRDPLLQYLAQARDDDEHGIGSVIEHDKSIAKVEVCLPQYKGTLYVRGTWVEDQRGELTITSAGEDIIPPERKFPYVRLLPVVDRGRNVYKPPETHMGKAIPSGDNILIIANIAVTYLDKLVEDAAILS